MFGIDDIAIGSIAAPVVGGFLGNLFGSGDAGMSRQAYEKALAAYSNIGIPSIDEQKVNLQKAQIAGQLSPEAQQAMAQGPSAMAGITTDPRNKMATDAMMQALMDRSKSGFSATELADIMRAKQQAAGQAASMGQATMQNMAARGMGGGGAELAARLSAAQNASNILSNMGASTAGQAQQGALGAAQAAGQLGSQLRGQEFGEKSAQAQAADLIAASNIANRRAVESANTQERARVQQANLANAQDIMNKNTGISNEQEMYNKGLYQTNFNNQMQRAAGQAGQQQNMGNYYGDQSKQTRGMWSGMGQGVGSGLAGAYAGNLYNQRTNANRAQAGSQPYSTFDWGPETNNVSRGGQMTNQY
jgi:hypothetical protein